MGSEMLRDDWAYVQSMARRSEFPFKYVTTFSPWNACPISNCDKQFYAGPYQIDTLNTLLEPQSGPTRVVQHGNRPNTELFGTSPFRARGDGQLMHADVSNKLMREGTTQANCERPTSEKPYDRYDYIVFPNRAEWWRRGGESSRLAPVYTQPLAM